ELIKSIHALQVGCEYCNGPHLTKDCPNKPMMTPEEVNFLNQGGPREVESQKKINDEVSSYLHNQKSVIQNLESQVGRISQTLSGRTQGELPTQTQVNPTVEASKTVLMVDRS